MEKDLNLHRGWMKGSRAFHRVVDSFSADVLMSIRGIEASAERGFVARWKARELFIQHLRWENTRLYCTGVFNNDENQ